MAKIGMTMSRNRVDDALAQHFGKAKAALAKEAAEGKLQALSEATPGDGGHGHGCGCHHH